MARSRASGRQQSRQASLAARSARPTRSSASGNLDSERSEEVLRILRQSNQEQGQTFILVTHDPDVGAACDRIVRMRDGKVREDSLVSA